MLQCRERRSWTAKEDQLLRDAVEREDPDNPNPSKWHAIAKHVPHRTNKDCRKRWFAKMASDVVKGGWAPDEDERLVKGIEKYGTRWSLVASIVQTRNSDQCAKRWTDTLNPAIDRTTWTPDADELLLQAVNEHGKVWTKIVKTYFPGRTGLSAKNRYNSITRFNVDHSRGSRVRRKSSDMQYMTHRKSESTSSSSSSVSPSTPSIPMPDASHTFSSPIDSNSESYLFDSLSNWSQTPSPMEGQHEGASYYTSASMFGVKEESDISVPLLSLPPVDNSQSFNPSLNASHTGTNDPHVLYTLPSPQATPRSSSFRQNSHGNSSNIYPMYNSCSPHYPAGYSNNEPPHQMSVYDPLPPQGSMTAGLHWGGQNYNRPERSKLTNSLFF